MLPWQDEIARNEELEAYARAVFVQAGIALGAGWIVRTHFSRYRSAGCAYAAISEDSDRVINAIESNGVPVCAYLPIVVLATERYPIVSVKESCLLVLEEDLTATAAYFKNGNLISLELEPRTMEGIRAMQRLVVRSCAKHGEPEKVFLISDEPHAADTLRKFFAHSRGNVIDQLHLVDFLQ
jgi:hypothetical protein